jgi:hypothetical protein
MSGCTFDAYAWAPQEIGPALAERMSGASTVRFLEHVDVTLKQMHGVMLAEGYGASRAFKICRMVRQIAQEEWQLSQ